MKTLRAIAISLAIGVSGASADSHAYVVASGTSFSTPGVDNAV